MVDSKESVGSLYYRVNKENRDVNGFVVRKNISYFELVLDDNIRRELNNKLKGIGYLGGLEIMKSGVNNYKSKFLRKLFMDGKICHIKDMDMYFDMNYVETQVFLYSLCLKSRKWGIWRKLLNGLSAIEPENVQEWCARILCDELAGINAITTIQFLEEYE